MSSFYPISSKALKKSYCRHCGILNISSILFSNNFCALSNFVECEIPSTVRDTSTLFQVGFQCSHLYPIYKVPILRSLQALYSETSLSPDCSNRCATPKELHWQLQILLFLADSEIFNINSCFLQFSCNYTCALESCNAVRKKHHCITY